MFALQPNRSATPTASARFSAAAEALGRALELDPRGMTGQEALVLRNVVTGRLADGVTALRQALVERRDPDLLVMLGSLLLTDRADDEGLAVLREALAADPTHVRAAATLAAALRERGDADGALRVLSASIDAGAGPEIASVLARTHLASGRADDARAAVASGLSRAPKHVGLHLLRLRIALLAGDLDEAEAACNAGITLDDGVRPFHQAGVLAALRGDHAVARTQLTTAVERFDEDTLLRVALAFAAAADGAESVALGAARTAADRGGRDLHVVAGAALAMVNAGDAAGADVLVGGARSLPPLARDVVERHIEGAKRSEAVRATLTAFHLRVLAAGAGPNGAPPSAEERAAAALSEGDRSDLLLLDLLGNARLSRGDTTGAADAYRRIVEQNPELRAAREKLALLQAASGAEEAALRDLAALFGSGDATVRAHALAGTLYDRGGDVDAARRHLEIATRMEPENATLAARLAHILERSGEAVAAEERWEQTVALDPMHVVGNARLAELVAIRDPKRAETLARRAVALAPKAAFARRALAYALAHSEDHRTDEALAELEKAVKIAPNDSRTWTLRGTLLFAAGRLDEARAQFDKALSLDTDDTVAHLYSGMLSESRNDLARAGSSYERVIAIEPQHPVALNNLAAVLMRTGRDLKRARRLAQDAVQLSGGRGEMLDTLGWIEHRMGDSRAACSTLQRAVAATGDNPTVRYHLAEALAAAGRKHEALRELAVLARYRDFPERAAADALLRRIDR